MPIFKPSKLSQQLQPLAPEPPQTPPPHTSTRSMPEEPQRKGLLARLRNLQLSRPDPKPEILPDIEPQPVDPQVAAKAKRREARREQRRKREEQWDEEYRKRRNFAVEIGSEMRPLTPLSDFDSASEDERQPASQKQPQLPPPSHVYAPAEDTSLTGERVMPPTSPASPSTHQDINHPQPDQSLPQNHLQTSQNLQQQTQPPYVPRDPKEDAKLAEMFAAQAFTPTPMPSTSQTCQNSSYSAAQPHHHQPSPIGWGGVYHSVPSQPMFGTPMHLTPPPRAGYDIEPILADNIRRGRELAMMAIQQEESGNLGAAEAAYIKALSLLIPASKQLDTGSELNKNARMLQKAKIQREAAAMLDRCEELRTFLRANGPAVPSEMPVMPNITPPRRSPGDLKKQSSLGAPPSRNLPPTPSIQPRAPPTSQTRERGDRNNLFPPPSPSQQPAGHNRSHLLTRLASRKDVLASASTLMPPDSSRKIPPSEPPAVECPKHRAPRTDQKCFMCSAPAHLRAKCGHTYCSNCGNQAVYVFGECPVLDCGARIAVEDFEHIL